MSLPVGKGRWEDSVTDPPVVWIFWRRHVNPRAATVQMPIRCFSNPCRFWGLFCNFKIVFDFFLLFVIFLHVKDDE